MLMWEGRHSFFLSGTPGVPGVRRARVGTPLTAPAPRSSNPSSRAVSPSLLRGIIGGSAPSLVWRGREPLPPLACPEGSNSARGLFKKICFTFVKMPRPGALTDAVIGWPFGRPVVCMHVAQFDLRTVLCGFAPQFGALLSGTPSAPPPSPTAYLEIDLIDGQRKIEKRLSGL